MAITRHNPTRAAPRTGVATRSRRVMRIVATLACCLAAAVLPGDLQAGTDPAPRDKGAKPVLRIAFAGDSIVDNYWEGILRVVSANPCLKTSVELGRFARNGTGLTRGDKLFWPREVRRIGETFRPDLFVLSVGLNDRQFIVDGGGARTAWGAPDWTDKYRGLIAEFLSGAAASKAGVLLVGLPIVRDSAENADLQGKNKMFADAVARIGAPHVQYVAPWRLRPEGADAFASYGPDRNGRTVQIRTSDGEHFTVAGEDLVAGYLYPQIVAAFERMGTRLDRACASAEQAADRGADTTADKGRQP
jgi:hypothetical protein